MPKNASKNAGDLCHRRTLDVDVFGITSWSLIIILLCVGQRLFSHSGGPGLSSQQVNKNLLMMGCGASTMNLYLDQVPSEQTCRGS